MCFFHLGFFFGPIISGIIIGMHNFRVAMVFVFILSCLMLLLNCSTATMFLKKKDAIDSNDNQDKLSKSNPSKLHKNVS